jgi:hypothetical protein
MSRWPAGLDVPGGRLGPDQVRDSQVQANEAMSSVLDEMHVCRQRNGRGWCCLHVDGMGACSLCLD